MRARLFSLSSLHVATLLLLALSVCVGCDADKDATDDSTVKSCVDGEPESKTAVRVAMSKDSFIDYVANESPGRPGDGFVLFLKLPGNFTPEQRSDQFVTPIDLALREAKLGKVINGAAMMGAKPFSSVSVEVSELAEGLDVVIATLRAADAPPGTEIRHGEGDDKKFLRFDSL